MKSHNGTDSPGETDADTSDSASRLPVLRVAHVIDTLNVGGAEVLVQEFCRHQHAANVESMVFALRTAMDNDIADSLAEIGIQTEVIPSVRQRELLDFRRIRLLKDRFSSGGFDVVHTHLQMATIYGGIAGRWAGLPVVTTLHSVHGATVTDLNNRVKDFIETQVLRRTVSIAVGCGPRVTESNADRVGSTVQATIANPVSQIPQISEQQRTELRHQFLGDSSGPLFMSVGRLTYLKAYEILAEAFAMVVRKIPEARLVIVGKGEDQLELESLIGKLGLADHMKLAGSRRDVPALLRSADVFVMSSRWEGLPIALLEAMAAECPIIATRVGDIVWAADDTAKIVAPESATELAETMIELASDPAGARSLGQRARVRVEKRHSPIAWVKSLREVYEQAIAQRG